MTYVAASKQLAHILIPYRKRTEWALHCEADSNYDKSPEKKKNPGVNSWPWPQPVAGLPLTSAESYFTSVFGLPDGRSNFQLSYQMTLKSCARSAGFCGTHSTGDPMWMWSTGSSPAQQGFPLAERSLCSTFSRRNTCPQILLFTFQPFCQLLVCLGLVGVGILEDLGAAASHPKLPWELRQPLLVQAYNALSLTRFLEASMELPATKTAF